MVLLHGIGDSHRTWLKVAPLLAKRRRVLMPDLPGHGLSGRPDASYSIAWHAQVVGKWLAMLGLEDVDMVGHSYGGGVAQWLLLEHRARIRRLALVAPGGLGRDVSVALRFCAIPKLVEKLGQPFMGAGTRVAMYLAESPFERDELDLMSWMNAMPGTARAFARTLCDVIDLGGQRRHFLEHAHEIAELPPIAIYWGDRDKVIPHRHAKQVPELFEAADIIHFYGSGHFPHIERPHEIVRYLEAFFDASDLAPTRARGLAGRVRRRRSLLARALASAA